MKIDEFVEKKELYSEAYLQLITEVAGSHKLSKKIEKLIKKLEEKKISIPGNELPDLRKIIDILKDEILKKIKFVEKEYERGNLNARQVAYKIKKYKGRALQVKKFLQEKKILSKFDWRYLIDLGLGLMWIPVALPSIESFIQSIMGAAKVSPPITHAPLH